MLLMHSCATSPLPRLTSVGSAEQALQEAQTHAQEGRWSEAIGRLAAARREFPENTAVAAEEQRLRDEWERRKARLEDELFLARSRGTHDEVAALEPLVKAEPRQLRWAWALDYKRQELKASRAGLLQCSERQLEPNLKLAVQCLNLAEQIEADARSRELREQVARREAERRAMAAARDAERAARMAKRRASRKARSTRREQELLNQRLAQAEKLFAEGKYAQASAEIDGVLAENPDHARALRLRSGLDQVIERQRRILGDLASRLYADGEVNAAIRVWEALLNSSPDHAETRERIERARRVQDRLEQLRRQQELGVEGADTASGENGGQSR